VWRSKAAAIVALAALLVVAADRVVAWTNDDAVAADFADRLFVQPSEDGVYLLGNSMFKTGVDPERLEDMLGGTTPVDFEYHNGHYSNLWYLIARTALGQTEHDPRVVVWGFRPYYAMRPAFRQNGPTDNDLFAIEDPLYERLEGGETFTEPPTVSSARFRAQLASSSGLYQQREDVQAHVADTAVRVGVDVLDLVGVGYAESLRASVVEGDRTLADEIVRLGTGGETVLTEELVVDGVGDFIVGPVRPFADTYIPATAEAITDAGLDQVVVIWRPVIAADGSPAPEEDAFVADALAWFESQGIPVLDLYNDERVERRFFASGDHYNEEGRELITGVLARFLRDQDVVPSP
jgi:hypothetical protein